MAGWRGRAVHFERVMRPWEMDLDQSRSAFPVTPFLLPQAGRRLPLSWASPSCSPPPERSTVASAALNPWETIFPVLALALSLPLPAHLPRFRSWAIRLRSTPPDLKIWAPLRSPKPLLHPTRFFCTDRQPFAQKINSGGWVSHPFYRPSAAQNPPKSRLRTAPEAFSPTITIRGPISRVLSAILVATAGHVITFPPQPPPLSRLKLPPVVPSHSLLSNDIDFRL
jgi:hypothetical protein